MALSTKKEFNFNLSPRDAVYFLFYKKMCPVCGAQLKKQTKVDSVEHHVEGWQDPEEWQEDFAATKIPIMATKVDVTTENRSINYYCQNCQKTYTISDLSTNVNKVLTKLLTASIYVLVLLIFALVFGVYFFGRK